MFASISYRRLLLRPLYFGRRKKFYGSDRSDLPSSSESLAQWERLFQPGLYKGFIPLKKMEISSSRSSGPGGQNVNKSNTKVQVRFRIDECDWIATDIREKLFAAHKQRISSDGYFVIRSERTRSQSLNLADCLDKISGFIRECKDQLALEAAAQPTEEDLERASRRQAEAERRRIQAKRSQSERKRGKRVDNFV